MTTGISPQIENMINRSNSSKNVEEIAYADQADTITENIIQVAYDIESTSKYSKKTTSKKRKKSKRKKTF